MLAGLLWIPATLIAAAAQTARNAMQRQLTDKIGIAGATQVRFLYGLPFAILFLVAVLLMTGETAPVANGRFLLFAAAGAATQIAATGAMLAAMRLKTFAAVTAYLKTEPVLVALVGFAVLGDVLSLPSALAIAVATGGVILISVKPGAAKGAGWRTALLGIGAGGLFALSAIGFRGAILSLPEGSSLVRATTTLVWALGLQTLLLVGWLCLFNRAGLTGSFKAWRQSLAAGFMGALASQFWFIGFALTSAANVRTLALVEVLFAAALSRRVFSQLISRREVAGLVLVVFGVGLLLALHP